MRSRNVREHARPSGPRRAKLAATLAALCVLTAQSPAPSPSALPEIGRTHSKGLCTTVRDNVAPAVLGLMKSDELIAAGHRTFRKMAADETAHSADALDLDRSYLNNVATAMAHNLALVDRLLDDAARFPKKSVTDDDRVAQTLKAQLAAVADEQRKTLNLLNNALDADEQGRMRIEKPGGPDGIGNAVAREDTPLVKPAGVWRSPIATPVPRVTDMGRDATSFIGADALNMKVATKMDLDARTLAASTKAIGHTVYDQLDAVVETRQAQIARAEQVLSPTVAAISAACKAELAPAPSASP